MPDRKLIIRFEQLTEAPAWIWERIGLEFLCLSDNLLTAIPETIGRLTNLRQDIAARQDTSGDKFSIELDGQTLDNRGIAGELIVRRAETDD